MDQITDSQELARGFNDDEAVWQCYEYIRARRLLCGVDSVLSDEVQDALDWIEAEHKKGFQHMTPDTEKAKVITKQ
jgi:hypothetical protein